MGKGRTLPQHGSLEAFVKRGYNVGSGQRPFHSNFGHVQWINVDSVAKWNPDLVCDGNSLPCPDGDADYFVLHHVLEHFGCGEGDSLIREAYRVLKPGGSLLVFVPDLRALALRWMNGEISTEIYVTNLYGAYMGHEEDRHKWGFDSTSLAKSLAASADWTTIMGFNWRHIEGANLARDWWIIGMEAVK